MEDMLRGLSAKDTERLNALLQIEVDYETGKIDLKEARRQLSEKVGRVHPYDIAKAEQHLVPADDEECRKVDMKKTLQLLDGFLDTSRPDLPAVPSPLCFTIVRMMRCGKIWLRSRTCCSSH